MARINKLINQATGNTNGFDVHPDYKDTTPTTGSTNVITSGAVKAALDEKQDTLTAGDGISIVDGTISSQDVTIYVKLGDVEGNIQTYSYAYPVDGFYSDSAFTTEMTSTMWTDAYNKYKTGVNVHFAVTMTEGGYETMYVLEPLRFQDGFYITCGAQIGNRFIYLKENYFYSLWSNEIIDLNVGSFASASAALSAYSAITSSDWQPYIIRFLNSTTGDNEIWYNDGTNWVRLANSEDISTLNTSVGTLNTDVTNINKVLPTTSTSSATGDVTATLQSNTFVDFGEVDSLSLTLSAKSTTYNEYMFQFTTSANFTALTLSETVTWANEDSTFEASKTYQVSILNGLAVKAEF